MLYEAIFKGGDKGWNGLGQQYDPLQIDTLAQIYSAVKKVIFSEPQIERRNYEHHQCSR